MARIYSTIAHRFVLIINLYMSILNERESSSESSPTKSTTLLTEMRLHISRPMRVYPTSSVDPESASGLRSTMLNVGIILCVHEDDEESKFRIFLGIIDPHSSQRGEKSKYMDGWEAEQRYKIKTGARTLTFSILNPTPPSSYDRKRLARFALAGDQVSRRFGRFAVVVGNSRDEMSRV